MTYPYFVLDVPEGADDNEVRAAYLRKVQQHPPEAPDSRFQEIHQAYELIKTEAGRARLALLGMPGNWQDQKLADLVPTPPAGRRKLGVKTWMDLIERSV